MYVENLIGPHTINTVPAKTSAIFAKRGKAAATLEQGMDEAVDVMTDLATAGIDLAQVTRGLLDDGIEKFVESFDDILQTIAAKSARAVTKRDAEGSTRRPSA
jgi:transaldolase/glucose-6-phosphate isomerase